MTTPSLYEQVGLTACVNQSLFRGNYPLFNFQSELTSYSHRKSATGGWVESTIGVNPPSRSLEDWLEGGVGRDIVMLDSSNNIIFNGFVDLVEVVVGGKKELRGPLSSIGNKVKAVYSTVDTSVSPPVVGVRTSTPYVTSAYSQALYGVITKILSMGGATDVDALRYRDAFLASAQYPLISGSFTSQASQPSLTLRVKGYYDYLKYNPYNSTSTGTVEVSAKIGSIIAADPNGILSAGVITTNTLAVPGWEDEDRIEEALLRALTNLGDVADNRYTLGVYEGRKVNYLQAPLISDLPRYTYSVTDHLLLTSVDQNVVRPWEIQPAQWIFSKDWLIGRTELSSLDPRYLFVEDVTYTAPWDWSLNGARLDKVDQLLAKLQLRGQ